MENDISSWLDLEKYIQTAKRRASTAPTPSEAPVVIDLGPLTFTQDVKSSTTPPMDARDQMLRTALGLGGEPEVWCELLCYLKC